MSRQRSEARAGGHNFGRTDLPPYARSASSPAFSRRVPNTLPCSMLSFAVEPPVVNAPGSRASSTTTSCPARASRRPVTMPVRPAPATTTSAAAGSSPVVGSERLVARQSGASGA